MIAFYQALYVSNPVTTGFEVDTNISDILVRVNGALQTEGVNYEVQATSPSVTINFIGTLPAVNDIIEIYRESDVDSIDRNVNFGDLAFLSSNDFNNDSNQLYYLIQENNDLVNQSLRPDSSEDLNFNAEYGGQNRKIINVSDPENNFDVANKQYVDVQDAQVLSDAKAYTDSVGAQVLSDAQSYADAKDILILNEAKSYTDTGLDGKVSKTGDDMFGALDMNGNSIILSNDPVSNIHAANKNYVDTVGGQKVSKTGDSMTGDLDMNDNRVILDNEPVISSHAVNKAYVDRLTFDNGIVLNNSAGLNIHPTINDNGDGSVDVIVSKVTLYTNPNFIGEPLRYIITGGTYTLTDNATNYIIADYNGGNPIVRVTLNDSEITESDVIPIATIIRTGLVLHILNWNDLGQGLANKLHQSIVKTQRYRRESGLAISEYGTRNINLTAGVVWTGANSVNLEEIKTAVDNIYFFRHVAGVWEYTTTTQYNNSQYDNGTNLVNLTPFRYAVNWVYRGIENQKHLYMVLGTGNYTLAQANASQPPTPPAIISSHAVLVGKIIVQQGSNIATSIQSAFDVQFTTASVVSHQDLINLELAGTGVTYGHIRDTSQTIYGNKSFANSILVDAIDEYDVDNGIYVDGVHFKDGGATFTGNVGIRGANVLGQPLEIHSSSNEGLYLSDGITNGLLCPSTLGGLVLFAVSNNPLFLGANNQIGIVLDTSLNTTFNGIVSMPKQSSLRAYRTSSQGISDTTLTKIQFNAFNYDNQSELDTVSNIGRVTFDEGGIYEIDLSVDWNSAPSIGRVQIYKNGSLISSYTNNNSLTTSLSDTIKVSANDYIEAFCYQQSGGGLVINSSLSSIYTYMTVNKIS